MKFLLALTALPSAFACLHTWGYIVSDCTIGTTMDGGAQVVDNGVVVCDNNWGLREDQDGHFAFNCLPGYVYAVEKTGTRSWFRNNANTYSWINNVKKDTYCCHGACDDRKGLSYYCTDYSWDTWQFC
ncbi:hypothetical protein EJ04DRAFT_523738 [Polyplosphaeria fusca]|uniref:Uncharacterized protein n=1 Tax=Polyplosphaeria fusca TaxID=682080 RepID=A0A9P4V1A0_9PLEO|nr:hypothetical protein EJ04DRAFT_523738 [Polyplosphaeria fusca]